MNFSGKITNSFLSYYYKTTSTDLTEIVEGTDLPIEFLRDPTCWLPAKKVEAFLSSFEKYIVQQSGDDGQVDKVGHMAKELKSWGVLDSVLCMIERPHDIFLQPQRFISYFISQAPPIANIHRGLNSVTFDLPISFEEFPHTLTYLKSAIECVPLYTGSQMAECMWRNNTVSISWHHLQPSLDDPSLNERKMAPEVMQNLIHTLEKTELALHEKTIELEKIKIENQLAAKSVAHNSVDPLNAISSRKKFEQQVLKLQDYFTRSQQLITLLIGQDRNSSQISEAMKRVSWEKVQESFPKITQEILNQMNDEPFKNTEFSHEQNHKSLRPADSRQPWLPHN